MIKGIIVGHQEIGRVLHNAIECISGACDNVFYFTNNGLSTNELTDDIRNACVECSDGVILFVDMYGGSCWQAAKKAGLPNATIISGLNLPMMLSFINKRNSYSLDELAKILVYDGKRGIRLEPLRDEGTGE